MSTWKSLNVESDHEEEDDVDDTKEIQIEEALKLYQTALKHHSEGPQSFEKTADAYKALFASEIFKYPESISEYTRHELHGDSLVFDSILQEDFEAGPVQSSGGNESAPNTLPQILHLSYKNHGQFLLETMQYWVRHHGAVPLLQGSGHIVGALNHFAEALDKEDTDLDLWLRTASVAAMLGSHRITRFCLEAVLDGNDELYESLLRLPGLEEGFAGHQLRELVIRLEDKVSLMQRPFSQMKQKKLAETLKKRLNPYPFAPLPADMAPAPSLASLVRPPNQLLLQPIKWDWAGVGEAILRQHVSEQSGLLINAPSGSRIILSPPTEQQSGDRDPSSLPLVDGKSDELSKATSLAMGDEPASLAAADAGTTAVEVDVDTVMEEHDTMEDAKSENARPIEPAPPQSRKRSTDSAGLPETAEGGRSRSKRLRAREVTDPNSGAEVAKPSAAKQLEDQLWPYIYADQCLCEVANDAFARLGVDDLGSPNNLRKIVSNPLSERSSIDDIDKAAVDMFTALHQSAFRIAPVLLNAEPVDLGGASREAGLNAFLGNSKSSSGTASLKPQLLDEKLDEFSLRINNTWSSTPEVAFAWLEALLGPGTLSTTERSKRGSRSSYMHYRWTEDLKRNLVQIIVNVDEFIYQRMIERIEHLNVRILKAREQSNRCIFSEFDVAQVEMVETLFELHLDVYSLIKHPNSGVDIVTQNAQRDRLERWAVMSREAMQLRSDCTPNDGMDELVLRHIWASVFQMSVSDDVPPEHVLYTMEELKAIFSTYDGETIEVQNNAVMPELSVAAIDRELVRMSMKDFFLKVFDTEEKDPVAVIESLEPILEPPQETEPIKEDVTKRDEAEPEPLSPSTIGHDDFQAVDELLQSSPSQEMRKYLDSASVHLRLSLWQRLREAYEAIEYSPKVLSCYLRSIETLVAELKTTSYQDCPDAERHVKLISRLRIVDEVIIKVLQIIRGEKEAFDCLSYSLMQTAMSAITQLLRLMSATNFFQDLVRIGNLAAPRIEGFPSSTFMTMTTRLNDIQLRLWILQYYLLKEGMSQNAKHFPVPADEAFEFLRHVHHATGVRGFCHLAGRMFLRLEKDELLRLQDVTETNSRDVEFAQVLYDLYGLKTFVDPQEGQEFNSSPDILDKKTATSFLPFILSQSKKIGTRDILKHDLKITVEKVHGALGRPKTNEDVSVNRKVLNTYLKSAINPTSLYNCLRGIGSLSTKHIPAEDAVPASKGWYYLMGMIALNRFRSQKRNAQGPTEDLNFAQVFFLQDLEYDADRWETWYRLAQTNDLQLEESVSWTADKMNSNSMDLINYQRAAVHCYTMAVACAVRDAGLKPELCSQVARMYTDFGNRLYSSSREPFSMHAFTAKDTEHKYFSGIQIYQDIPFKPLSVYTAWKLASVLFRRSISRDPEQWWNHYMLGKCLWKMWCANFDAITSTTNEGRPLPLAKGPTWEQVIDAITDAIEMLPEKKERGREPVLEPHYKLVSVVHKLFLRKTIDYRKGKEIIRHSSFAQNTSNPEGADDWDRYILGVLKALRSADKSSWHHRIIARAAHVIYNDSNDMMVAHGAKHELTQQIFTKTMAVQVWKPENERPGRHFVYTTRYTKFFVQLLDQTGDKNNFEALARRVRRKTTDFFEHWKLWQELCMRYIRLLRRIMQVPDGHEDTVFRTLNNDEYNVQAARIEAWSQQPSTQHPILNVLRDTIELKRLNQGLMKAALIDDLIGDTFALLYSTVGPTLPPLPSEQPQSQVITNGLGPQTGGPALISSFVRAQGEGPLESQQMAHPATPQGTQLQHQPADPVVKSRNKTVGKREIQRRAEACAQKPSGAASSTTTTMPIRSPPTTTLSLQSLTTRVSPEKRAGGYPAASTADPLPTSTNGVALATTNITNFESAPASIHDDADDESELSELDESEVQEIGQEVMDEADQTNHAAALSRSSLIDGPAKHQRNVNEQTEEDQDDNVDIIAGITH